MRLGNIAVAIRKVTACWPGHAQVRGPGERAPCAGAIPSGGTLKCDGVTSQSGTRGLGDRTAALREAKSNIPTLGYTVPYAIGNILLTAWRPVLVVMMSR